MKKITLISLIPILFLSIISLYYRAKIKDFVDVNFIYKLSDAEIAKVKKASLDFHKRSLEKNYEAIYKTFSPNLAETQKADVKNKAELFNEKYGEIIQINSYKIKQHPVDGESQKTQIVSCYDVIATKGNYEECIAWDFFNNEDLRFYNWIPSERNEYGDRITYISYVDKPITFEHKKEGGGVVKAGGKISVDFSK